jgi:two-component system nitrogen regulation response regulator NtrX
MSSFLSLPLRERGEDIHPLTESLLQEVCAAEGLPQKSLSQNVWAIFMEYDWPGNVRELRNVVERAAVLTTEPMIEVPILTEALRIKYPTGFLSSTKQTLRQAREEFEREFIVKTLAAHQGKIQETAQTLGIQRSHLWKKMKRYGIGAKSELVCPKKSCSQSNLYFFCKHTGLRLDLVNFFRAFQIANDVTHFNNLES